MNTSGNHGSARIYQFPAGGRAALGRQTKSIDERTPCVSEALCSDAWYHQEAIRESKPPYKPSWER